MNKKTAAIIRFALFMTPFVIGTVGFYLALQDGILNALYRGMRLYFVEMDCEYDQVTPLIELARWTAPVMTGAAVLTALSRAFGWMKNRLRVQDAHAVAIHGDSPMAASFAESLGASAVTGEDEVSFQAAHQVLLFGNDRDMLTYLGSNREKLFQDGHRVYLCTEQLQRGNFENQDLVVCNFAENCARAYWREHPIGVGKKQMRIALIGFGSYGRQLLTQALLTNVYGSDTKLCYHVFGDSHDYRCLHTGLDKAVDVNPEKPSRDSVFFHEEAWYDVPEIIRDADRIIVADDREETNLLTLNALEALGVSGTVHLRIADQAVVRDLWSDATVFGTMDSLCTREAILDEASMASAKKIHSVYYCRNVCRKSDCTAGGCGDLRRSWNCQNAFTLYSNVAQADHAPVKLRLLLGEDGLKHPGAGAAARKIYEGLSPEEREKLHEIEHLRWMRYHYLNNWDYAPARDNARRRHPLLVPFGELSQPEREKDADAWYNAFELYE